MFWISGILALRRREVQPKIAAKSGLCALAKSADGKAPLKHRQNKTHF
ncbi:MAG: hypothetical protein JXQ85_06890 [Cognatishimia sp.]